MGPLLNLLALEEAIATLRAEAPDLADPRSIARHVIRTYLFVAREKTPFRSVSDGTLLLAGMAVGETIRIPATDSFHIWNSRRKSARKIMAEPLASWQVTEDGEWFRIRRLADGARPRTGPRPVSTRPQLLANMRVGAEVVLDWKKVEMCYRRRARVLLGFAGAEWSQRRKSEGLLVRRVS